MVLLALILTTGRETIYARSVLDQQSSQLRCEYVIGDGAQRKSNVITLPSGPWSVVRFGVNYCVSARSAESPELVITWAGGRSETIPLANPLDEMRICNDGKYLLVSERKSQPKQYSTEVFRLGQKPIARVGIAEGRGVAALAGQVLVAQSAGREAVKFSFKNLTGEQQDKKVGANILAVANKRQAFWQKDAWRYYGNGEIRPPIDPFHKADGLVVSNDGKYWFEKSLREYVIDGQNSAHFFSGHVLFDRTGMVAQWKFHRDSLRGVKFSGPGHLRTFWTEEFLFGNRKLSKFGPGLYDLDLRTMRLTKEQLPTGIITANPSYILIQ
ncbi:MAG: hypothetical protein WCI55_01335 [Armatimonadota bacterium]